MRARDLLRPLALAALLPGCAAHDVHEAPAAPPQGAPSTPDAPLLGGDALPAEALAADDEVGLVELERLLADKETRLRAAGVLLAQREEVKRDNRYAPPPPEPAQAESAAVVGDKKRKDLRPGKGRSDQARPTAGGSAAATPTAPKTAKRAPNKPTTGPRPADEADAMADAELEQTGGRCQTICELADATCELESKICDLAARHAGEPKYADLCRRAGDDCRLAAEACQLCSP